jgi:hypothetical protein
METIVRRRSKERQTISEQRKQRLKKQANNKQDYQNRSMQKRNET